MAKGWFQRLSSVLDAPCRACLPWEGWLLDCLRLHVRTFAENILPKTKIMDGLLFLSLFSPYFLLSAWEPLQRVRCVGARRQAVIVKRTWKYNWKQTLLRKADLGELLLWGSGGFQVFPLFGADVSEHLFCEMNHLWILHLGVIDWEMAFF